jgi:hypothetical protein
VEQRPGPTGTTSEELAKFGVDILNPQGQRLQCARCGQVWAVWQGAPTPGCAHTRRPQGYWRCVHGCNRDAARPGDGTEADLLKVGVAVLNFSGLRLRCKKCGNHWPTFRGAEGIGFPVRWWECLAGCNAKVRLAGGDVAAMHLEREGLLIPLTKAQTAATRELFLARERRWTDEAAEDRAIRTGR